LEDAVEPSPVPILGHQTFKLLLFEGVGVEFVHEVVRVAEDRQYVALPIKHSSDDRSVARWKVSCR
jgi:hypothetical protein